MNDLEHRSMNIYRYIDTKPWKTLASNMDYFSSETMKYIQETKKELKHQTRKEDEEMTMLEKLLIMEILTSILH